MDKSVLLNFLLNNISTIAAGVVALAFFIVNIIIAIKNKDLKRLKQALLLLPEVICEIEQLSIGSNFTSIQKKAMAESLCKVRFGSLYKKYGALFDDAIEDILKTPQKKGGSLDVSQKSEER